MILFINWSIVSSIWSSPTRLLMLRKWRPYPASLYSMPPCPYAGHGVGAKWIPVFWFIEEPPLRQSQHWNVRTMGTQRVWRLSVLPVTKKMTLDIFLQASGKLSQALGPVADSGYFSKRQIQFSVKNFPFPQFQGVVFCRKQRGFPEMMDAGILYKCSHSSSPNGN